MTLHVVGRVAMAGRYAEIGKTVSPIDIYTIVFIICPLLSKIKKSYLLLNAFSNLV